MLHKNYLHCWLYLRTNLFWDRRSIRSIDISFFSLKSGAGQSCKTMHVPFTISFCQYQILYLVLLRSVNFHCHCDDWLPPNHHHHLGGLQCSWWSFPKTAHVIVNQRCIFNKLHSPLFSLRDEMWLRNCDCHRRSAWSDPPGTAASCSISQCGE